MVIRFLAGRLTAFVVAAALAACSVNSDDIRPNIGPDRSDAEAELVKQSRALQRTIMEAAVAGTVTVGVLGGDKPGAGLFIGLPIGLAAGTYVGLLQQQYRTDERRLERLREDIDLSNAEVAAAIQTMRVVLAQQQRELAAVRQTAAAVQSPELTRELGHAQANLNTMRQAISGAEKRQQEFGTTRSLRLVEDQITGIDPQLAELAVRIQTMREIAETLAQEI